MKNTQKYTIGVDFGTQSCRALLVDTADGRQVAASEAGYAHGILTDRLPPSGKKLPPETCLQIPGDYIDALRTVIRSVLTAAGVAKEDVIGIALDCTTSTVIPLCADLTPLCEDARFRDEPHAYIKLWKHHASAPYADRANEVLAARGPEFADRFGGRLTAESIYAKVWQVAEEAPAVYDAAAHFAEVGDWLTWLLTGVPAKGCGYAAYKGCYDISRGGYPTEDDFAALDPKLRHLIRDKMSAPVLAPGVPAGRVSASGAELFGLAVGTAVGQPHPDGQAPAIGLGLRHNGDLCATIGTSSAFMLIRDGFARVDGMCGTAADSPIPGFRGYSAGVGAVGDLFAWAARSAADAATEEEARARGLSVIELLTEKCEKKRPGETGLLALDWFAGNKCCLADSALTGAIFGLTLQTRPEDIFRALVEATAFDTRNIFESFAAQGLHPRRVIAAGGIPRKSPFIMQLYADVLGLPIGVTSTTQGAALGSAITAAAAAGTEAGGYPDLLHAMEAMSVRVEQTYLPHPDAGAVYDRLYAEYRKLYDYFGRVNPIAKTIRGIK